MLHSGASTGNFASFCRSSPALPYLSLCHLNTMENYPVIIYLLLVLFCGFITASKQSSFDIEISYGGEVYSPTEIPSETSIIVSEEVENLLGELELQLLSSDLRRLGRFMRIACNGIGAAGHKYTKLQIEIQRLGYNITDLVFKTSWTLNSFKARSKDVLRKIKAAYLFLLDGHEEIAVQMLSSLVEVAKTMQGVALELHGEFIATKEKVIATVEHTPLTRGEQGKRLRKLALERVDMEQTMTEQERLAKEAQVRERRAKKERLRLQMLEDDAVRELTSGNRYARSFANYVSKFLGYGDIFTDNYENVAELFHKWKLEQHELEVKDRELCYDALNRLKKVASRIANIDSVFESEENIAGAVVEALHESVGALKNLAVIMIKAADFWKHLEERYATSASLRTPTLPAEYSTDKHLALWTSNPVKEDMVRESARWVALQCVCKDLIEQMKQMKEELFIYLQEDPTKEESQLIIGQMANEFYADVVQEQNSISKSLINKRNEMDKLKKLLEVKHSHQEL